jgi:hypothetical protein
LSQCGFYALSPDIGKRSRGYEEACQLKMEAAAPRFRTAAMPVPSMMPPAAITGMPSAQDPPTAAFVADQSHFGSPWEDGEKKSLSDYSFSTIRSV